MLRFVKSLLIDWFWFLYFNGLQYINEATIYIMRESIGFIYSFIATNEDGAALPRKKTPVEIWTLYKRSETPKVKVFFTYLILCH